MFVEFYSWFLSKIIEVFAIFKRVELFNGFTLYNFLVALIVIPIFYKIFGFIMDIEYTEHEKTSDEKWLENKERNLEYNEYQNKLREYERKRNK